MRSSDHPRSTCGKASGALILLAAALALAAACTRSVDPRPNVILILIDTLRSDHLSVAGYPAETSPFLEELAARGTFFEHFYAHSAVTRPSVATLWTSRFISGHGISNQGTGLAGTLCILPELFQDAGYRTLAFVTNPQIHPRVGFARGFDRFEALFSKELRPSRISPHDLVKVPADEVFSVVERDLERHSSRRFFAFVHLLDPHGPYQPRPADAARFVDPSYRGNIIGSVEDFGKIAQFRNHPADLKHFQALYDAEIAATDRALAGFVAWLEQHELLANTHLIITADHGEEFLEHGGTGHGRKIFEETTRVPLLWLGPGVPRGRRIGELAGLIDVLPTLVDLLELPAPPGAGFQGRSLRSLWAGSPHPPWRQALFLEGVSDRKPKQRRQQHRETTRAMVTKTHKVLARDCPIGEPHCRELEVYDLTADPEEQHRRRLAGDPRRWSAEDRELVRRFRLEMARALRSDSPDIVPTGELPAADRAQLEALGYVVPAPDDESPETPEAVRIFADGFETGTDAGWSDP
ncbi:MAG: sulfatase [bacterium]|nr:sulfatase [bacterium]